MASKVLNAPAASSPSGPGLQQSLEILLKSFPSSSEFTGSINWAHRNGDFGQGAHIIVQEGADGSNPLLYSIPEDWKRNVQGSNFLRSHGLGVISVIRETAPQAQIRNLPVPKRGETLQEKWIRELPSEFSNKAIMNASFSPANKESLEDAEKFFSFFLEGKDNLLVVSAGNEGQALTLGHGVWAGRTVKDLFSHNSTLKNKIIIVGSLDKTFKRARYSNYPHLDSELQGNFLCTLGEDVPVRQMKGYKTVSGTSYAAPAVSAVAALLISKYADLSLSEISQILLKSAEKNFIIEHYDEVPANRYRTLVYDAKDPDKVKEVEKINFRKAEFVKYLSTDGPWEEKSKKIPNYRSTELYPEEFSSLYYGQGVLSARRAFLYADLYNDYRKKHPHLSDEERFDRVDQIFRLEIKRLDNLHATNIQKAFRGWKVRKSLKKGEEAQAS